VSGVQLWVALPDRDRQMSALFQHVERVPLDEQRGGIVQVFAGSLSALQSPARHHSGIFGGDVQVHPGAALDVPLEVAYEYAALVLSGDCSLEGQPLQERVLCYLGANRSAVCFTQPVGRPTLAGRWSTVPREDSDVVELCGAHASRDCRRTYRLGGATAVRRSADSQVAWGLEALNGAVTEPLWKTKPSWYLVSTDSRSECLTAMVCRGDGQ
jgi:hypothetical protein